MTSQTQMLLSGRKQGSLGIVDKGVKISRSRRSSPQDYTPDMLIIAERYIQEKILKNVWDAETAEEAVSSLEDNPRRGDTSDFVNFIRGVGKADFTDVVYRRYAEPKLKLIENSKVTTKSGKVRPGFQVNRNTYLTTRTFATKKGTKKIIQAKSLKTGRFVKTSKVFIKRLKEKI